MANNILHIFTIRLFPKNYFCSIPPYKVNLIHSYKWVKVSLSFTSLSLIVFRSLSFTHWFSFPRKCFNLSGNVILILHLHAIRVSESFAFLTLTINNYILYIFSFLSNIPFTRVFFSVVLVSFPNKICSIKYHIFFYT
jgi:hypothetical protein